MAELNQALLAAARKDDRRFIACRRITVGQHFTLEAPVLRPLPAEPFDYQRWATIGSTARPGSRSGGR